MLCHTDLVKPRLWFNPSLCLLCGCAPGLEETPGTSADLTPNSRSLTSSRPLMVPGTPGVFPQFIHSHTHPHPRGLVCTFPNLLRSPFSAFADDLTSSRKHVIDTQHHIYPPVCISAVFPFPVTRAPELPMPLGRARRSSCVLDFIPTCRVRSVALASLSVSSVLLLWTGTFCQPTNC